MIRMNSRKERHHVILCMHNVLMMRLGRYNDVEIVLARLNDRLNRRETIIDLGVA